MRSARPFTVVTIGKARCKGGGSLCLPARFYELTNGAEIMFTSRTQSNETTNGVPPTIRPVVAREIRELEQRMGDASRWIAPLHREMGKVIVGQKPLVDRLLLGSAD